jgi:hypothetical protein
MGPKMELKKLIEIYYILRKIKMIHHSHPSLAWTVIKMTHLKITKDIQSEKKLEIKNPPLSGMPNWENK